MNTEDYSCRSCGAALFVPDGEDPLEEDVRFCGSCAIDEIERLRDENKRLAAHDFDLWLERFEQFVAGQAEKARQQ